MLTKVRGILQTVADESVTLLVDPFEIEVLIPEHTRRLLQSRLGEPVALHTIFYIEGGAMVSRMVPRLVGFLSADRPRVLRYLLLGRRRGRAQGAAGDGPAGPRAGPHDPGPGRQGPLHLAGHRRGDRRADRRQAQAKVGKFALIVGPESSRRSTAAEANGEPENAEPDVIRDTYAALLSVGHTESQAREAIDRVLSGKKKFKSVADMIEAIYLQTR